LILIERCFCDTIAAMLRVIHLGLVFALLMCAVGCKKSGSASANRNAEPIRIISLSPAISRTLADFNLQDRIVGRTPHCKSIDQSIPVAGDLMNIDYEAMIRLKPTHVLVQPPIAGIDQHLVELAGQQQWKIGQWHLNERDDIETMIRELPGTLFDDRSEEQAKAAKRSVETLNEIAQAFSPGTQPIFRGRTLILHSLDPVLVSGKGTYLDDILNTLGASNATEAHGWAQLSVEDIVRLDPQAIIVVRPGADQQAAIEAANAELAGLEASAVKEGRIAVAISEDGEMPSSGIINVANEFKQILRDFEANPK
jgi:ABC-type hemin transport system substrate-binding protein